MSISVSPRDITFSFPDSCNCSCCCFPSKFPEPDSKMYVNTKGEVEQFNPEKAKQKNIAIKRSLDNLSSALEGKFKSLSYNDSEYKQRVRAVLEGIPADKTLTAEHIVKINTILYDYVNAHHKQKEETNRVCLGTCQE